MLLTAYKINNVIKAYGEQLRQELSSHVKKTDAKPAPNRVDVSAKTRRKGTIEKIISCVVERITHCADQEPVEKNLPQNLNNEGGAPPHHLIKDPLKPSALPFLNPGMPIVMILSSCRTGRHREGH